MENASKALLIAGAILIAILLIAIGMMVFNSASGVIDTASSGMTDNQKTIHNKKFTMYEGKQSVSVVKDIFDAVEVNNKSDGKLATVTIKGETGADAIDESTITSGMYNVKCYPDKQGVIVTIRIYK